MGKTHRLTGPKTSKNQQEVDPNVKIWNLASEVGPKPFIRYPQKCFYVAEGCVWIIKSRAPVARRRHQGNALKFVCFYFNLDLI